MINPTDDNIGGVYKLYDMKTEKPHSASFCKVSPESL